MTALERELSELTVEKIKARQYECFMEDHESKPWTPGQCAGFAGKGASGMFRDHSCWKCLDGKKSCVVGNPRQCEYPHAKND